MENKALEQMKKQHVNNYKNAILDIISNNTSALIGDIRILIKKPPLETMDLIKVRFLSLAKKNKVILNTVKLDKKIDGFRNNLLKICVEIEELRVKRLTEIVKREKITDKEVIKINKKDFIDINREIKKIFKSEFDESVDSLLNKLECIFSEDIDVKIKNLIINEITKYIKNNYLKQLLENFDIKILVKDTTLINSIKEQNERYKFTLNNSRILNDLDK
ncbi:MAG: hypothetical protein IJI22_00520 [Bacilli bacterium]|nr:hypothetical protein [Bacilli bacterium]